MQTNKLGQFIRAKRETIIPKVSLNKFAFENNIEPAMLSRIETGKQDITYSTLKKIAQGFGLATSQLLNDYENSNFFVD